MNKCILFYLLLVIFLCSSFLSEIIADPLKYNDFVISNQVDLKGDTLRLLPYQRLFFKKGAQLKNGVIVGNMTTIAGENNNIFCGVKIEGTWNVPKISTYMFVDIKKDDALVNLFALTNKNVKNIVVVAPGNYWITIPKEMSYGFRITSNTEVIINGTIRLRPNNFKGYKIIDLYGENIFIHGKGVIIGDRKLHFGKEGEWGMGINISGGKNVKLSGLIIKDCWGDCIYIRGRSTDVQINNCLIDGGRRQGISITSAGRIFIENCIFRNIGGTKPEYAIDIEPNNNKKVEFVSMKKLKAIDCKGGFKCGCRKGNNSSIGVIIMEDCSVSGKVLHNDFRFRNAKYVKMKNNTGVKEKILLEDVIEVVLEKNSIKGQWLSNYKINNCKKVTKI